MSNLQEFSNDQLLDNLKRRLSALKNNKIWGMTSPEEEILMLSEQLREAEREKSTFLSNVRNEINNPLTSILGLAESITRLSKEEKIKSLSVLIHKQTFDLDFQMRNIILASEIESGNIQPMGSLVNVCSLIESQLDYLSIRLNNKQVAVKLYMENGLYFDTDAFLLQSILANILANAIEHSSMNKVVTVKAGIEGNQLKLVMQDAGEGIPIEKRALLFRRFRQLDSGSTKVHSGHGLGLAIAHELTNILGGTIDLQSTPGAGTSVTIHLPTLKHDGSSVTSQFGNDILFGDGEY